ncbi:MAG: hypothetical protein M3336_15125, partial [Chloroflexota bacterium]|nr:hypothetical protein [Chloroflexota bacterium]
SASMACGTPDKLAFGASVVAALAHIALNRSDAVRVACLRQDQSSVGIGPLRGRARFAQVVRFIEGVKPAGRVELNAALTEFATEAAGPRMLVLMSDLLSPSGIAEGLDALLARRLDVVVLHAFSPDERDPRLSGEVELVDAETGQILELGASLATLQAYRARYAGWLAEQESVCASRGLRYVRVASDRPLDSVVLDDLRRAQVLR